MKNKSIYKEMNEGDFYTRIREDASQDGKVYYLGIEPFSLGSKSLITNLNKSMFIFNSFNINENNKIKLREFRDYFYGKDNFKLNSIVLHKGNKYDVNNPTALDEISKITNSKIVITEEKISFNFNPIDIDDEYKIFKIIYITYKSYFKDCDFKYSNNRYLKKELRQLKTIDDNLKTKLKELVDNYELYTHEEAEKKYQHLFLKNVTKINNEDIIPFEEEYYINDNTESGRIDCIYYSVKDKQINNIYLIELKVDDKVIGGSHGIHRHLLDIKNLSSLNPSFYDNLLKRIKYRNEVLGLFNNYTYSDDLKKHFYIVIAKTNNSINLEQAVKGLNDSNSKYYKQMLKEIKEEKKVDVDTINKSIKDIYDSIKDIDIKLFIDENTWNKTKKELKPKYIEKTEWLK